jgi:hypothetical protein
MTPSPEGAQPQLFGVCPAQKHTKLNERQCRNSKLSVHNHHHVHISAWACWGDDQHFTSDNVDIHNTLPCNLHLTSDTCKPCNSKHTSSATHTISRTGAYEGFCVPVSNQLTMSPLPVSCSTKMPLFIATSGNPRLSSSPAKLRSSSVAASFAVTVAVLAVSSATQQQQQQQQQQQDLTGDESITTYSMQVAGHHLRAPSYDRPACFRCCCSCMQGASISGQMSALCSCINT